MASIFVAEAFGKWICRRIESNMKYLIVTLFVFSSWIGRCQEYQIKTYKPSKVRSILRSDTLKETFQSYKSIAFNATQNLPRGYKKSGKVDYTEYIQSALDSHDVVILPNFPVLINDKGIHLKDDQVLLFDERSKLVLSPSEKTGYHMILVYNRSNVKIFNPRLLGDRNSHKGTEGQWGFGVSLRGVNNVKIYGANIQECWGDGIYVGSVGSRPSKNVLISNSFINNNRRNGISITSGENVTVQSSLISNSNGHSPQSGIDIEPNRITDEMKNITISNVTTENNKMAGILLVYEMFKGEKSKSTSVDITNHSDYSSKFALGLHGFRNNVRTKNLEGTIRVINTNYRNDRVFLYRTFMSKLQLEFDDPQTKYSFEKLKLVK